MAYEITTEKSFSLLRMLYRGYCANASKPFAICDGESASYAQGFIWANALLAALRRRGVEQGQTAIVSMKNSIRFPLIVAALQELGVSIVMVSPQAGAIEYENAVLLMHPKYAFVLTEEHRDFALGADPSITVFDAGSLRFGSPSVSDMAEEERANVVLCEPRRHGDSADVILFSSGTTGAPKAIANSIDSYAYNAMKLGGVLEIRDSDVIYVPAPCGHVYGFVGTIMAIFFGATFVSLSKYTPEASTELMRLTRTTVFLSVGTMLIREMRADADGTRGPTSLRAVMVAGASCPREVMERYEKRYRCHIVQSYGMTEAAGLISISSPNDDFETRVGTVGKLIDGVRVTFAPDSGEILIKTPALMKGKVSNGAYELFDVDDEGWLHSGDVGSFNDEGQLTITGRIKDIVIRGGINIFPLEVERAYEDNGSIQECCLVGYPDPDLGERTCLCVILRDGRDDSSADLRRYAKGRLEKCKYPDIVLKMKDFPRLPNGKTNKAALRGAAHDALQAQVQRKGRIAYGR